MAESGIELKFIVPVGDVPEEHKAEAECQVREAYVLLCYGRATSARGERLNCYASTDGSLVT